MKHSLNTQKLHLSEYQYYWIDFVAQMTIKEIKSRYRFALLGFLWMFLNPVLQMIAIGIVFQFIIKTKIDNYFIFLFTGLLPWNFFSLSLNKVTPSLIYERFLIQKAKFPREGLVISIVLSYYFHFLISSLLFFLILIATQILKAQSFAEILTYSLSLSKTIPVSLVLLMLTIGFSLLFSAMNVQHRDTNFIVKALIQIWFYMTPIVYRLESLPIFISKILYLNPMVGIVEQYQKIFLGLAPANNTLSLLSLSSSIVYFTIGIYVFSKKSPYFNDWL